LQASRTDLNAALKTSTRGAGDRKGLRIVRSGLILIETALSIILLIGAGLLIRSFSGLMNSDFGFNPDRVLTMRIAAPSNLKEKPQQIAYYMRLIEQVRSVPDLTAAGLIGPLPLGGIDGTGTFAVKGQSGPSGERQMVKLRTASPGYFTAMGLTLLRGRVFDLSDTADSPRVVVINDSLQRRYFPAEDPIGKQVYGGGDGPWYTVVGVVRDVKHMGLTDDPTPELYHPLQQFIYSPFMTALVVRTAAADPTVVAAAIQKQIRIVNPDQPINDVLTMTEIVSRSAAQPRFYTLLLGIFAAIAVLLTAAGLYGVLSYTVSRRLREIGIRVALGASTRSIMRDVVGRAMALVLGGVAIGVAGAYACTRLLSAHLYQVTPTDPATYTAVCILLATVAACAAWLPARRATQVDPSIALRAD
jgi:putative ABC transport system permease protein